MTTANDRLRVKLRKYSQLVESGCIEWQAFRNRNGYGIVNLWPKTYLAHRAAWAAEKGPVPAGMHVCHHCDNPACINVEHLFLGTPAENCADKIRKGRARWGTNPQRGLERYNGKLSSEQVLAIRAATESQREIAARFGIAQQTVSDIKRYRRRGEVTQ